MISRRGLLANLPVVFVAVVTQPRTNDYSPLPKPRFHLGQRVRTWRDLEGFPDLVESTGTVRGLCWKPEGWRIKVGWVYYVWFPPHPLLDDYEYWEDIPEFDLETC